MNEDELRDPNREVIDWEKKKYRDERDALRARVDELTADGMLEKIVDVFWQAMEDRDLVQPYDSTKHPCGVAIEHIDKLTAQIAASQAECERLREVVRDLATGISFCSGSCNASLPDKGIDVIELSGMKTGESDGPEGGA